MYAILFTCFHTIFRNISTIRTRAGHGELTSTKVMYVRTAGHVDIEFCKVVLLLMLSFDVFYHVSCSIHVTTCFSLKFNAALNVV